MADEYTLALLRDDSSRLHAAVARWPWPLPDWMARHSVMAAYAALGVELEWPWDADPLPTDEEIALAHKVMAERSAIPD